MTVRPIIVRGPAMRVGIIGAYLAAKALSKGKEIILDPKAEDDGKVLLRPDFARFHAEVGIEAKVQGHAHSVLATTVRTHGGDVSLPFSPFGLANGGVEFHHYWKRASGLSQQPKLSAYSLALALEGRAHSTDLSRLPLVVGARIDRSTYADLLLSEAQARGAKLMTGDVQSESPDSLVIDCSGSDHPPLWKDSLIRVASESDIDGLEALTALNAAKRLVGLAGDVSAEGAEIAEYNRLAQGEVERIGDMRELLISDDPRLVQSPTLKRKVDLFEACGRIPTEDFEVFTPPEWLAALMARGVMPRRYDRIANLMPESDLLNWLSALRQQIVQIAVKGVAA